MGRFSKLPYLGMKLGHWPKFPFYPRGSKLCLFSLYRQWFPRYGVIFKIAILVHETWPLTNDPEVAHIIPFYLRESKLSLFSL